MNDKPDTSTADRRGSAAAHGSALEHRIDEVLALLRAELLAACRKHAPMHSPHEGYAVIVEEVDELWQRVKCDQGRDKYSREEALQIAAMGVRYVLDVAPLRPPCALCDRGDGQLGHADDCPKKQNTRIGESHEK